MNDAAEGCLQFVGGVLIIAILIAVGIMLFECGQHYQLQQSQAEAIDAGLAEWTIDPKSGERAFTWKGAEQP